MLGPGADAPASYIDTAKCDMDISSSGAGSCSAAASVAAALGAGEGAPVDTKPPPQSFPPPARELRSSIGLPFFAMLVLVGVPVLAPILSLPLSCMALKAALAAACAAPFA